MIKLRNSTDFLHLVGRCFGAWLPKDILSGILDRLSEDRLSVLAEAVAKKVNRRGSMALMPQDLAMTRPISFEALAGMFSSSSMDHSVISMTVRQAAYLYHHIQIERPQKVLEIGRYKGGSTLLFAASMDGNGELWSVDLGVKETRVNGVHQESLYDQELTKKMRALGLIAQLLIGDSRIINIPVREWDLVFIDGDHSYEGVRSDFERFGLKVKVGGAVFIDDAYDDGIFEGHADVHKFLLELLAQGDFIEIKRVNRMSHLQRLR